MLRAIHRTSRLGILTLRGARVAQTNCVHTTNTLHKKPREKWVQDQSQREVNAILDSQLPGPSKKNIHLLTFEDEELGIMKLFQAKKIAEEKALKLVVVDEKSNPMVYKLMDGKQLMDFNRHLKKDNKLSITHKHKKLQLTLKTSEHDLEMKLKHAMDWIKHGHDVDIEVKSKGLARDPEVGRMQAEMMKKLTEMFGEMVTVHQATRTDASLRVLLKHNKETKQEQ